MSNAMRRCWTLAPLLVLALVACNREPPATPAADLPPPASDQPVEDVPPATAPPAGAAGAAPAASGMARWDGYGDARFGMGAAQVRQAWPGALEGSPAEGTTCFHLSPAGQAGPARLALMIEDDRFVRYSVESDAMVAPGGGRVGMDAGQIAALYPDRVREQPHKYVEGGRYLRIPAADDSGAVLLFEVGADGVVDEWRLGLPPQVDYVEGCS